MSPSMSTRFGEGLSPAWLIFREVATTEYPRSKNARTTAAPIPCEPPVTITVALLAIVAPLKITVAAPTIKQPLSLAGSVALLSPEDSPRNSSLFERNRAQAKNDSYKLCARHED